LLLLTAGRFSLRKFGEGDGSYCWHYQKCAGATARRPGSRRRRARTMNVRIASCSHHFLQTARVCVSGACYGNGSYSSDQEICSGLWRRHLPTPYRFDACPHAPGGAIAGVSKFS